MVGPDGKAEVDAYCEEWSNIAAHEQAVADGGVADGGGGISSEDDHANSLALWTRSFAGERRRGHLGRLPFVGMCGSAMPVANGEVESNFSRLKANSSQHQQHMAIETLQYLFLASENKEGPDPALQISIRRYVEARETRSSSFFMHPNRAGSASSGVPCVGEASQVRRPDRPHSRAASRRGVGRQ